MNVRDSQWLATILEKRGFVPASLEEAGVILINTCSVREKPQKKIESCLRRIDALPKRERMVGILGCAAKQEGEKLFDLSRSARLVAGGANISDAPDAIERLLRGDEERIALLDFRDEYPEREYDQGRSAVAYVNIMQGCDNFCAYCVVPYTRGRQRSRRSIDIMKECERRLEEGAKEIILLGQNVNAWGADLPVRESFASLLDRIAAFSELRRLRFVSPHPADMDGACVDLFGKWEKICPRLHLPLQSGSDRILKRMRRRYDSRSFLELASNLRKARPDIALSSDIIVGFPGETERDFHDTLDVMREAGFMASYSFCYSDRPGTLASLMPDKIEEAVKNDRLNRLQILQEELGQAWLRRRKGELTSVLIEGPSPRQDSGETSWQGRDPYGIAVHLKFASGDPTGKFLEIRVTEAKKHSLLGELARGGEKLGRRR